MGYYSGNPDMIMDAPVRSVLNIIGFVKFKNEYDNAAYEMNKAAR